jgi:hypothetical protein
MSFRAMAEYCDGSISNNPLPLTANITIKCSLRHLFYAPDIDPSRGCTFPDQANALSDHMAFGQSQELLNETKNRFEKGKSWGLTTIWQRRHSTLKISDFLINPEAKEVFFLSQFWIVFREYLNREYGPLSQLNLLFSHLMNMINCLSWKCSLGYYSTCFESTSFQNKHKEMMTLLVVDYFSENCWVVSDKLMVEGLE